MITNCKVRICGLEMPKDADSLSKKSGKIISELIWKKVKNFNILN